MKKILLSCILFFSLSFNIMAETSDIETGDKLIYTGKGLLGGIVLVLDGTNSVTVSIYDGTSSSGRALTPPMIFTTSSTTRIGAFGIDPSESFKDGLYVDITTAGTVSYIVYYEERP